jgi:hypothetical protein
MFMIKSEVVGQPSVVSDELVQCERRHFKMSELSYEFLQISCEIITVRLGCHKFCTIWVLKKLTGAQKCRERLQFWLF